MDSRFDFIRQRAEQLKKGIEDKRSREMGKHLSEGEKAKAAEVIKSMVGDEGYCDEKAAEFLYKEHAIEMKPSTVATIRKSVGIDKRAKNKPGRPKKSAPGPTAGGGAAWSEVEAAYEEFVEKFETYKGTRQKLIDLL